MTIYYWVLTIDPDFSKPQPQGTPRNGFCLIDSSTALGMTGRALGMTGRALGMTGAALGMTRGALE